MATSTRDPYDVLGVPRDASAEDIRRAHRKLARRLHPDVSDDPDAEERFKAVSEAYDVLSDPERRARLDRAGRAWDNGPAGAWPGDDAAAAFGGIRVDVGDGDLGDVLRCAACGRRSRVRPVARGTPRCGSCRSPLPWVVDATAAGFDAEARAAVPVLVDLWAPWCAPCRTMAPVLEQLARERAGRLKVVRVDVDAEPAVGRRFAVQGIPLLVLLRDGEEVARRTGAAPLPRLTAWLDEHHPGAGA